MFGFSHTRHKIYLRCRPSKAAVLNKELEIYSLHDLIYYFPYKYVDRSRIYYIHEIDGNIPYISWKGEILCFETIGEDGSAVWQRIFGWYRSRGFGGFQSL